ncbi:hypothetical protein L195_g015152, partial [Trifolium pratense]
MREGRWWTVALGGGGEVLVARDERHT